MRFGQRPMAMLKSLTLSQIDELRAIGSARNYRKNERVFRLGEVADALYIVLRGRVRLQDTDSDGREVTVGFAADGELFGLEALAGYPDRTLSAIAAEGSEILSLPNAALWDLLSRDGVFSRHLLRHAGEVLVHKDERVKMLAFLDVPSRLAGLILWLADRYGVPTDRGLEVPYWFTHQEMADLIGSTRETVTTVVASLKREGLVDARNHHFIVLNRMALAQRIGFPDFGRRFERAE